MSSSNQIGYQWKPTTNKIIQQKKKDFSKINAVDETGISLCIRFAFKNITPNKVFAVMKNPTIVYENGDKARGSFGFVDRIDYIIRRDGNKTYFVHFRPNSWNYNNTAALQALNDMKKGKDIEIINDKQGHFWKVSISQAERPEDEVEEQDDMESDQEEFQIYPASSFENNYNNLNEFPNIEMEVTNEVTNEIAAFAEQINDEEKTAEA